MTDPLEIVHADCIVHMATMPENSIDAIVTDPPYGLEFMGKEWDRFRVDPRAARWSAEKSGGAGAGFQTTEMLGDKFPAYHKRRQTSMCRNCGKRDAFRNPHACGDAADWVRIHVDAEPIEARAFQNWTSIWAAEAYRVLKPGGLALVFGGSRTHHRMMSGLEDGGFVLRDCLMWLYGQGFPKSLDIGKAFDKKAGAEREKIGEGHGGAALKLAGENGRPWHERQAERGGAYDITAPATELARQWDGYGTALKPAYEAIVLAQKPVDGAYTENVERWGVGGLNIADARIGTSVETWPPSRSYAPGQMQPGHTGETQATGDPPPGRWPTNVLLDEEAAAQLDEQTGVLKSGAPGTMRIGVNTGAAFGTESRAPGTPMFGFGDSGGASRFFYVAKASASDRGIGNLHPTVKPVDLMRYLVRLIAPRGALVLDPFAGSGTTGQAALAEGRRCLLIEKDAEYVAGIAAWRGAMQTGLGL